MSTRVCSFCDGSGRVAVKISPTKTESHVCPPCNGTGRIKN